MEPQETKPAETKTAKNGKPLREDGKLKEEERLSRLLAEGKIAKSQENVASKDLKRGRRYECLPYLHAGRGLDLDLAMEASDSWYDETNPEVFNTAVSLLRCPEITVGKLKAARSCFDTLPEEKELTRLVSGMDDAAFAAYLEEYRKSRDPVALSRRISGMEDRVKQIQQSVDRSFEAIGKIEKLLESAAPIKKEPSGETKREEEERPDTKPPGNRKGNPAEEPEEEAMHREFETQKAGLQRIEKLYQSGKINDAQKKLARFHVMAGIHVEDLPYLQAGIRLTIGMVDGVSACMEAGMDADTLSGILRQENMTEEKLQAILEIYPNIPGKDELIRYINEAETEEELKNVLTEYKNRNDIRWVRAQLKEKEGMVQRLGSRNKEMEEEIERLRKEAAERETEGEAIAADRKNGSAANEAEREAGQNLQAERAEPVSEDGTGTSVGDTDSGQPAADADNRVTEPSAETGESVEEEAPPEMPGSPSEAAPVPENAAEDREDIPFLKRLFPGFYNAERKEVILVRQKAKAKEKREKELRAEMKRTLEDLYAQDVIDEESFYIFAELAFKEQRMDKKAATFLVTEMRNGVPFPLLCKVIKYVKDSGDWSYAAQVLGELIRYQEAMDMQTNPLPAGI